MLELDFYNDILNKEDELREAYGFQVDELKFLIRNKPTTLLQTDPMSPSGLPLVFKFFVDKYGFKEDYVRTLLVKYPFVMSKSEDELESFFS